MTKKERVKLALQHKTTDIVPYHIGFTSLEREKVIKYYKSDTIFNNIGNHLARISAGMELVEINSSFFKDEFGVIWDRTVDKDAGVIENVILEGPSLSNYKFPDPYKEGRFDHFNEFIEENKDYFIICGVGFSLFERAWTLRGMENLLCDMVVNPGFVEDLLDSILEFNMAIIKQSVKFNIDGMRFGDDWGQQQGLIMGPIFWRKFIKPRIAKMYERVKSHGLKVFIHSCGDVEEIFPDLIEVGVDVFNPFQPEVYDIYKMKELYGEKLSFFGGMSTQRTLPWGTVDEVRGETKKLLEEIGKDGGYIFSPAHGIPGDVPIENVIAMLDVLQNQFKVSPKTSAHFLK